MHIFDHNKRAGQNHSGDENQKSHRVLFLIMRGRAIFYSPPLPKGREREFF